MNKLNPWSKINNGGDDSERASIIRALLGLGKLSGKLDLWLPFPQNLCCFSFGKDARPIPVGALLILWERSAHYLPANVLSATVRCLAMPSEVF